MDEPNRHEQSSLVRILKQITALDCTIQISPLGSLSKEISVNLVTAASM